MKRIPIFRIAIAALFAASLSACSWFHQRPDYYTKASEARPLEVPPDLDTPPTQNELVVPQPGSGAARTAAASGVTIVADNQLQVADTLAGTWQRVGVALDRARLGSVSGRDETAHVYTVDVGGTPARPASDRHWYNAVLEHLGFGEEDKKPAHKVTVTVAEAGGGASVVVTGDSADQASADATRRVVQALHDNLATSAPVAAAPAAVAPPAPVSAPAPMAAPVTAPPSASTAPPALSGVTVGGSELHVADSVQNTWQRVGLALERAQIGALSGRDPAAYTYTLEFDGTVETKPTGEHHWYSRILHPFGGSGGKTEQVKRSLTVRVSEDAGGSKVSIEGDTSEEATANAARRVVQVLRDRLS